MSMRIYRYIPDNQEYDNPELPTEEVWLEEDYPDGVMSNTPEPGMTLHEYESYWDERHGLLPRHLPYEERNFVHYIAHTKLGDFKRVKFEKLYRLRYYEVSSLEEFLLSSKEEIEVVNHRGHIFEKTWMD